jgi:hypothetical protein
MLPSIPGISSIAQRLLSLEEKHFPLLSLPQGILSKHLVPNLEPHEQASLSSTCRVLRKTVGRSVKKLQLSNSGDVCIAAHRARTLGHMFPNLECLALTLHTLHDTMYAAPMLLMGICPLLSNLSTVSLTDEVLAQQYEPLDGDMPDIHMLSASTIHSAAHPMETASEAMHGDNLLTGACDTCDQESSSHDLSSLLLSVLACSQCSKRELKNVTLTTKVCLHPS